MIKECHHCDSRQLIRNEDLDEIDLELDIILYAYVCDSYDGVSRYEDE